MQAQVIEGTWEEVQEETARLAREHVGERVRLIVLPEPRAVWAQTVEAPAGRRLSAEEKIRLLDELAERNRDLPVLPPEAFERESLYDDR